MFEEGHSLTPYSINMHNNVHELGLNLYILGLGGNMPGEVTSDDPNNKDTSALPYKNEEEYGPYI
jgi:hypothetical protein